MTLRDDPLLGPVLLCRSCKEEWPFDDEFWHIKDGRLSDSWLHRCIACCADYYAARRRLRQTVSRANRVTIAPKPGRCGALLRANQRCGRRPGHRNGHRSVEAMGNDAGRARRAA